MKPQNYKNIPIEARCPKYHRYKNKLFWRVVRINRKQCKRIKMLLKREEFL